MHQPRVSLALFLLTGIWLLLLSGCAGLPTTAPAVDKQLEARARSLEAAGDYPGAARLYLDAAARTKSPLRETYQLYAADSLLRGGDPAQAGTILNGITPKILPAPQQEHYAISRARHAISLHQPGKALGFLETVAPDGPYADDYRRLRGQAYQLNGDYLASVREFMALDTRLVDTDQRLANQFAIWEGLNGLSDSELQQLRTAPPPDALSGWMELVELSRLYLQQPDALENVIPHWQARYPGHPASGEFITELLASMRTAGQPPRQVALLLPLEGSLSGPATAIRDGILAAYYDSPEGIERPLLRIYDVGDDPANIMASYQQAVSEGALFVLGPLRKEAVEVLQQQEQLPVPVLALNQVEIGESPPAGVYQFGLSPEDEAREIARRALHDGHRRAIALIPEGEWGERIYTAFIDEWIAQGGYLLEQQVYKPTETDHGQVITTTLNLDSSKARQQRLVRLLGQPLEFEPRRRQDVDFIFLLATPQQARLIRPQLRFYRASRVPVYSTSHVYSGHIDMARDGDMNGIVFCDMPWTLEADISWQHLRETIRERWPANAIHYSRFYALGIDAYRVMPLLDQMGGGMFGSYHGVTGNLSLDKHQQLHRALRWARFRNGAPYLLESATEPALETSQAPTMEPAGVPAPLPATDSGNSTP